MNDLLYHAGVVGAATKVVKINIIIPQMAIKQCTTQTHHVAADEDEVDHHEDHEEARITSSKIAGRKMSRLMPPRWRTTLHLNS